MKKAYSEWTEEKQATCQHAWSSGKTRRARQFERIRNGQLEKYTRWRFVRYCLRCGAEK